MGRHYVGKRTVATLLGVAALCCNTLQITGEDAAPPQRYVLNYPVAQQFCPPVDSYADDIQEAVQKVSGRTVRHQLNGGYGLPVVIMVGDQHVLHLGADVAWYRVGAPVYAIADGVVRISQGSSPTAEAAKTEAQKIAKTNQPPHNAANKTVEIQNSPASDGDIPQTADNQSTDKLPAPAPDSKNAAAKTQQINSNTTKTAGNKSGMGLPAALGWGNLIVIEHRLLDGSYVTSIYGHLSSKRLVSVGDVVQAGQMIGTVGKSGPENGGFKPHLHFALRSGRMFQPDRDLLSVVINGKPDVIKLVGLKENEAELEAPKELPLPLELILGGHTFTISQREEKQYMPAAALNYLQPPDFPIVGYGLSTDGWLDPTEFLTQMLNQFPQAPFGGARRQPVAGTKKPSH